MQVLVACQTCKSHAHNDGLCCVSSSLKQNNRGHLLTVVESVKSFFFHSLGRRSVPSFILV